MPWINENDADLIKMIATGESVTMHFYLDSNGHPTIGYGHLIFRRDMPPKTQQDGLDAFIDLCKANNYWFKHKGTKKRATWDEVRDEVKSLAGIGDAKIQEWKASSYKEVAEAAQARSAYMNYAVRSQAELTGPGLRNALAVRSHVMKVLSDNYQSERVESVKAEDKFNRGYKNMGPTWWSRKTNLVFENASTPLLIRKQDISTLGVKPLKSGDAFSRGVGEYPKSIQLVIIDIVYNMGYGSWINHHKWKKLRSAISEAKWTDAEKILKQFPLDIPKKRRDERAKRLLAGGAEIDEARMAADVRRSLEKATRPLHRGQLPPLE